MAVILDAFAGAVLGKLKEVVEEEVAVVVGTKDELKLLERRMKMINSVLRDAERKRIQSDLVADWVSNLKDVLYDADDVIDLCRCKGAALLADRASSSSNPPPKRQNFSWFGRVPFQREISDMVKNLNQRLNEMNEDLASLNLLQYVPDIQPVTRVNPQETTSLLESDAVGQDIENATKKLVQLMTGEEGDGRRSYKVVAITGMGGIGKTTLAQSIFNHPQIQSEFSEKIWVCISQNFSETNLLAQIIRLAEGHVGDATSKAELLPLLREAVSGKRFFLVLDDVWRADVLIDLLRNPLQNGAAGSQVLVTTRDQTVARGVGAGHIHPVSKLSIESGWQLLCKKLFADSQDEEMGRLRDIGIKIVKKCGGLPLAIKAIAGVLISRDKSETEWKRVMRNDIWSIDKLPEEFRGALYLSYEDLPSKLKQCFLFCSIFPQDYGFYDHEIVDYWMAEGFVDMNEDFFVETAYDHIEELYRRNLIQEVDKSTYKVHDVLRSMAQYLSRNESFCGRADELTAMPSTTKLRRLWIMGRNALEVVPISLLQQKNLRTLFFRSCPRSGINELVVLPFLRLLLLSCSPIEDVPEAIGDLIHLRLLDLRYTKISSLPESIKNLTNLQVLNLSGCLSLRTLPKAITKLSNLLHLRLIRTPLQFIPAGFERMAQLNLLDKFVVGEDLEEQRGQGCRLEELKPLKQLRQLCVEHLERAAVCSKEGGEQQLLLGNKQHLKHLRLRCGLENNNREDDMIHKIEELFTQLAPPQGGLESLKIDGYFGRSFPNWLASSSSLESLLPHLTELEIHHCRNIQGLPPLGTLPQLKSLSIHAADGVVRMGSEFFGSNATSSSTTFFFPMLEVLKIDGMPNLSELSVFPAEEEEMELFVFPNLQRLSICNCPRLEHLPSVLRQSRMKTLRLRNCGPREIRNFACLTENLFVYPCQSLERISDLPSVRVLGIFGCKEDVMACPSLKCVENLDGLRKLFIRDGAMASLPEWLLELLQQQQQRHEDYGFSLELEFNEDLLKRCLRGCEYWPIIQDIPRVSVSTVVRRGAKKDYMKYTKKPFSYDTNL